MSDPSRIVTSTSSRSDSTMSKVYYAKISDVTQSSQNPRLRSDMSTSETLFFPSSSSSSSSSKDFYPKSATATEDFYDSGIQSESSLSSGIISETEVKYRNSSADCDCDSRTFSQESLEGGEAEFSSSDNNCNKLEEIAGSMRLDSGIDIDLSDRFSGSRLDSCSSAEISSSSSSSFSGAIKAKTSYKIPAAKKPPSLVDENPWKAFFLPDEDGNTKLHLAIIHGIEEFVQKYTQFIPDSRFLDIRNYYRQTCLHLAVLLNQPKITRLLLLAGAKTGIEDRNGNTALHLACERNHLECVKALLSPVTVYEQKYTIFKYKPVIDSPDKYINEYNYDGASCIHMAAMHQDLEVLHQLILNGVDVNIRECKGGYTILHDAVRSGNFNLVNYILQHSGIDVEKKNYARLTPYQLSAYHPRIAQILLDKGACRLLTVDDAESDDEDYSSDESESDDELYDSSPLGFSRISQVSAMISSLNRNNNTIASAS